MTNPSLRHYTSDEVNRIIKRALKFDRADSISHEALLETARELGINPESVEAAIEQEHAAKEKDSVRQAWLKRQRARFKHHLWSYGIGISGLLLINLFTSGSWWFQWPLLGWGLGMAFHFRDAYYPSEEQIEKGVQKMSAKSR